MQAVSTDFFEKLAQITESTVVTDQAGVEFSLIEGLDKAGELVTAQARENKRLYFIGNGANAGITSHMSLDYSINAGIRSQGFTDPALLTATANDFGVENMFAQPMDAYAEEGDIVMALSSSGSSPNVLKAVEVAYKKGCHVITMTGFKADNPLRREGKLNFWVPHHSYALVEVSHHAICHCLLEAIMKTTEFCRKRV